MEPVYAVTRSFQSGAGHTSPFCQTTFNTDVVRPINRLLASRNLRGLVVVVNAESGNPLAEAVGEDNETPTTAAFKKAFARDIASGRLIIHMCRNWGHNPGSATALNEGIDIVAALGARWVITWSPEIEMNDGHVAEACAFAEENSLSAVGFCRERWQQKRQWQVIQNTAALWRLSALKSIVGFSAECNGNGRVCELDDGYGEVPVAGMEDFHALLRLIKKNPSARWGMFAGNQPLHWKTDFEAGSDREKRHLVKVARQEVVMQIYAQEMFPDRGYEDVMNTVFAPGRFHQGDRRSCRVPPPQSERVITSE